MKVSFLIPTLRPDRLKITLDAIERRCGMAPEEYEILTDSDPGGPNQAINRMAAKAQGQYLCCLGDDTVPQPGFIDNALKEMAKLPDGWGLVAFNDGTDRIMATHFLIDRKAIDTLLGGELMHSGYIHCYADNEITERMNSVKRFGYAKDALVIHDHPLLTGRETDEIYTRAYSKEIQEKDRDLYNARRRRNFDMPLEKPKATKVAICIPSGELIHADFAMSLLHLCMVARNHGIQLGVVNHKSSIVEVGRSQLVESARDLNADYMLFLDSDMLFPADLLVKLLEHKKDLVCTDASTRRPPYKTVVRTVAGDPIKYDAKTEKLVELKGASLACCLINMNVFDKIERPYFLVTYSDKHHFLGEDYYFSNKVREAGFSFWCDTELSRGIGHIGTATADVMIAQDFQKMTAEQK